MKDKPKTISTTMEVVSVDIPTMYEMSDETYRELVSDELLFFVDHHDVLRSTPAGYPLATTRDQLDILIKVLSTFRAKLEPRDDEYEVKRTVESLLRDVDKLLGDSTHRFDDGTMESWIATLTEQAAICRERGWSTAENEFLARVDQVRERGSDWQD